jgi:hypothetical protein
MDLYAAMMLPGALTLVVIFLSWVYLKNAARLTSESLTTEMSSSMTDAEEKLVETDEITDIQVSTLYNDI